MDILRVDCGTCSARGPACADCMITALLGPADGVVELDDDEQGALRALSDSGLLPPLRLVRPVASDGNCRVASRDPFAPTEGVV